ncbi:helix-turn-helix domain-containing protein [Sorangium sp. So ce1036]
MLQTSARRLRLLTLLQTRRFWSGRELGERMDVTERTARRDVEKLRTLEYPIERSGGWQTRGHGGPRALAAMDSA